uniref:PDZ domain-containing protein n=1 Tax=Pelusios castaneus TaxID=367368 RepID=A0A8C8RRD4_9SAUR
TFLFAGLEDTKELTLKFEFNPKNGIDNPALSLAEDSGKHLLWALCRPRFYLLSKGHGESFGFCLREEMGYKGHIIWQVECGGLAQRRGLQDGDRILEVNGEYVDNMEHFKVKCELVARVELRGLELAPSVQSGLRAGESPWGTSCPHCTYLIVCSRGWWGPGTSLSHNR